MNDGCSGYGPAVFELRGDGVRYRQFVLPGLDTLTSYDKLCVTPVDVVRWCDRLLAAVRRSDR